MMRANFFELKWFVWLLLLGLAPWEVRAQPPGITNQPVSRALWVGGDVRFAVGMSDAGPFGYQWQFNGTTLTNGIITTVAGGGTNPADGGFAPGAMMNYPEGVAVDASGDLFIADTVNGRIREVNTNGIITTVAGLTPGEASADNASATNTALNNPAGVTVNASGDLLIADSGNDVVREVNPNGIMTIVAGSGTNSYSGDGGAATNAGLNYPAAVATDKIGDLFIADAGHYVIREVNTNGIITTVAGDGTNVYSGDGGPATNAGLFFPQGVTVDAIGNLYIADSGNDVIRKVGTNGIISTIAGGGTSSGNGIAATNAVLNYPAGVAMDGADNLFIADFGNNVIRKVDTNGIITTVAGGGILAGDGVAATNASLGGPEGVTVDPYGNLFIAVPASNVVRKVTNTQSPVLALNDVAAADTGKYRVVVTGTGGSVTSSVVNLTVTSTPLVYQINSASGGPVLGFVSQPGSTNVVLCATNLTPPVVWQSLSTNAAGSDGDWQFTDTNAFTGRTRFYRSVMW